MKVQEILEGEFEDAMARARVNWEGGNLSVPDWEEAVKARWGDADFVKDGKYRLKAYKPGTSQVLGTHMADMNTNHSTIRKLSLPVS